MQEGKGFLGQRTEDDRIPETPQEDENVDEPPELDKGCLAMQKLAKKEEERNKQEAALRNRLEEKEGPGLEEREEVDKVVEALSTLR